MLRVDFKYHVDIDLKICPNGKHVQGNMDKTIKGNKTRLFNSDFAVIATTNAKIENMCKITQTYLNMIKRLYL